MNFSTRFFLLFLIIFLCAKAKANDELYTCDHFNQYSTCFYQDEVTFVVKSNPFLNLKEKAALALEAKKFCTTNNFQKKVADKFLVFVASTNEDGEYSCLTHEFSVRQVREKMDWCHTDGVEEPLASSLHNVCKI